MDKAIKILACIVLILSLFFSTMLGITTKNYVLVFGVIICVGVLTLCFKSKN